VKFMPEPLRTSARKSKTSRGEVLFRRGAPASHVYWLLEGEVRLVRHAPDGAEIVLHRAGPGDSFAEGALGAATYHCTAVCTDGGEVLVMSVCALRAALERDPACALAWVSLLGASLRRTRARLERLGLKSARERVVHYLVTEGQGEPPSVMLSGPLNAWAAELGVVQETLYRTLATMEREGLIERNGRTLRLRPAV
jgi:CRP/FNR family transcriptional regulator, dissimilatory nitrate respiration regulator